MICIEKMQLEHWPEVAAIYSQGLESGNATFETTVPAYEYWDQHHLKECRFIANASGETAGWAALTPVSPRKVYQGVAEVSLYVHPDHSRKGVGSALLRKLITESEAEGFWMLQAVVFKENEASLALHRKNGFREVGYREKIGFKDGRWHDTILLEKRSSIINY